MNHFYAIGKVVKISKLCFEIKNKLKPYINILIMDNTTELTMKIYNEKLIEKVLTYKGKNIFVYVYGYIEKNYVVVNSIVKI